MAGQGNTVTDYMLQRKGGLPSAVSGLGSRFIARPTSRASTAESRPVSSSATATHTMRESDDDDVVPESESSHNVLSRMTLEDLLLSPGRLNMPKLVPPKNPGAETGAWFLLDHTVAAQIREVMEADFEGLYYNMTNTPKHVRQRWFKAFAQRFNWEIVHTEIIRKTWKTQAGKQLNGLVSDWKSKSDNPHFKPKCMGKTLWQMFLDHYKSADAVTKSKQNAEARSHNNSRHCTGQKSFLRRAYEMRDENGEFPSHVELLEDTHKRKRDGVVIDPVSVEIIDKCKRKAEERLSQMQPCEDGSDQIRELTKDEMNAVFKETAPIKRGRFYGLGSASETLVASSSFTSNSVISTLQTELQSTQGELQATKELVEQQRIDFEGQLAAAAKANEAGFKEFEDRFLNR